jgi:hypothetical protein
VLIGSTAGLLHGALAASSSILYTPLTKAALFPPPSGPPELLSRVSIAWANVAYSVQSALFQALALGILLVVLTMILRRRAAATIGMLLVWVAIYTFAARTPGMLAIFTLISAINAIVLARYGLLATAVKQFTFVMTFLWPLPDALAWYTPRGLIGPLVIVAIMSWGFWTALGENRLSFQALDD